MSAFRNCTWHFFLSRSVFLDERRMPWRGRVGVVGVVGVLGILGIVGVEGVEGREDWVEEERRCLDRRSKSKLLASESSESVDKRRPSSSRVNLWHDLRYLSCCSSCFCFQSILDTSSVPAYNGLGPYVVKS